MLTIVVKSPKAFKGPEQVFLPEGDSLITIRGFRPNTGASKKVADKYVRGKDMVVAVKAFGERFEWLTKLSGDFMIEVTGEFEVDFDTGNPKLWVTKEGKTGSTFVFKADKINVLVWGDKKVEEKTEEKADGTDGEVPF